MNDLDLSAHTRLRVTDSRGSGLIAGTATEWHKLTRSPWARWAVPAMVAVAVAAAGVQVALVAADGGVLTWWGSVQVTSVALGLLQPLLIIPAVAGARGQRLHLLTFTLEPDRRKVVAGIVLAVALLGLLTSLLCILLSAAACLTSSLLAGAPVNPGVGVEQVLGVIAQFVLFALLAAGLSLAVQDVFATLVAYYTVVVGVPLLIYAPLSRWTTASDEALPWIDLGLATRPLLKGSMTAADGAPLGTAALIWVVIPLAVGAARVVREDLG